MGVENLGNMISSLRRKKGITQEVLAEFIGVTKTSVSKWETGSTLPDIQVLPLLASFFEVTVDELVGYVPVLSREQIRFQYHRLAERFASDPFMEVLADCEEMVRRYYSCYPFLLQMAVLLLNHLGRAGAGQEREKGLCTAFRLCVHIREECKDARICRNAMTVKAFLHLMEDRADLALETLEETGSSPDGLEDMEDTQGHLWTAAYLAAGEPGKAARAAQMGMYRSLMDLVSYGTCLLQVRGAESTYKAMLLQRMDQIMETFAMLSLHPNMVAVYEYQAALSLAAVPLTGAAEEAIFARLERYVAACTQLFADELKLHGDGFFDQMTERLEELDLGTGAVRSEDSVRESVLEGLHHPAFACLKDQERLKRLENAFLGEQEADREE